MVRTTSAPRRALFYTILSAMIPLGLMIFNLYLLQIAPFGDHTLVFLDAESQYIKFFAYFQSILRGENDLFYSFSKTMGGDMLSLAAYYLLSPFNLLFGLFSLEQLPTAFTLVSVLKLSACGLTYYFAASQLYGHKATHLAFSTAYALIAYNTVFCWNIMWLDGVIILPLMSLGLTRLWQEGRWKLYAFTIFYGLVTNFYIGYMLCIASVLFCLVLMFLKACPIREKIRTFGTYAASSCIGGFAAAPVWLPTIFSLLSIRGSAENQALDFSHSYGLTVFPGKFVSGTLNWFEVFAGQPHVFCGTVVLLLVGIFFLSRKIPFNAKAAVAALLLVFIASFRIEALDVAWHGFSPNRAFNFRYSFLFSFLLIRIAHHAFQEPRNLHWATVLPSALAVALLFTYVYRRNMDGVPLGIISNAIVLLVCTLIFLLWNRKKGNLLPLLLVFCCVAEMGISLHLNWDFMVQGLGYLFVQDHQQTVQTNQPIFDRLREEDDGFYRIEQSYRTVQNDPMLFNYSGLSHFSSAEKPGVMTFLEKMGFKNCYGIWSYYNYGSTADADALLGVKYIMSPLALNTIKGYPLLDTVNGISIYENPNALPLAMLADPAIGDVSMAEADYFALHNRIWSGLTGEPTTVLHKEDAVSVTFENLQLTAPETYQKIDEATPASVRFVITVSQDQPLYAYFTSRVDDQDVQVTVNGNNSGIYFNAYRWDMFTLGTYAPGDTVTVELTLTKNELDFGEGYFYYEDLAALAQASATLRQSPVQLCKDTSSRLSGSFTSDGDQLLLLTIPQDEGWHITLDGKSVQAEQVLDCLLAIPVSAGEHTFALRYLPTGTTPARILSLSAVICTALWIFLERKKHHI